MSPKKLAVLLIVFVLLAGIAILQQSRQNSIHTSAQQQDKHLFAGVDFNQAAEIILRQGEDKTVLQKSNDVWVVASLYGYPADFEQLAGAVRELVELQTGQPVPNAVAVRAELGLEPGRDTEPLKVQIMDSEGAALAELTLGKQRMAGGQQGSMGGYPSGRYLELNDGTIMLVEANLSAFRTGADTWLDQELMNIQRGEIEQVTVSLNGEVYTVKPDGETYTVPSAGPDEEVQESAAQRLVSVPQYLRMLSLPDQDLSESDTGLDDPATAVFTLTNQLQYIFTVGGPTPDNAGRYTRIAVQVAPEASAEVIAEAEKLQEKFASWLYVIANYTAESMRQPRAEILAEKETDKDLL